jgi:hypothetical protein
MFENMYISDNDEDSDEFELEAVDEIEEFEDRFEHPDCISGKYYIGSYQYIKTENIILFATRVNIRTFYEFTHAELSAHAYYMSYIFAERKPNIHIMQLIIEPDDTFTAVIKTFWIKIIQRTWKKTYQKRKLFIERFKSTISDNINRMQINRNINHLQYPGLRGLLSDY